ncbi:hypothetical protein EDB85DRAFT_2204717 [Lactarius pseudohatsudake]|nr:hypothetical protein EDB85DRAFT_2204717 [Lactarius pseudohatsudake]
MSKAWRTIVVGASVQLFIPLCKTSLCHEPKTHLSNSDCGVSRRWLHHWNLFSLNRFTSDHSLLWMTYVLLGTIVLGDILQWLLLHFGTLDPADPNLPPRSFAAALETMEGSFFIFDKSCISVSLFPIAFSLHALPALFQTHRGSRTPLLYIPGLAPHLSILASPVSCL